MSSTTTLFDRQYAYNTANQISQIIEPGNTRTFGYDNLDRLTSVTNTTGGNESYSFDFVGNRTTSHRSSSYTYQGFNQLAATQTATYGFDANGNTASKVEGQARWAYLWDYESRLTKATYGKTTVRYVYDAIGRRVGQYAGIKGQTKFTYEGQDVLLDNSDGTLTKYVNGLGIDNRLRQTTGSSSSYFLADHLGSTNGLTDAAGALTASNSYDAFGNPTNGNFPSRYQFTGREFDSVTSLQFSRARWYDPTIGRFLSEDPIGFDGGDKNLYGYVKNSPTGYKDPLGLIDPIVYQNPNIYDGGVDFEQILKVKRCYNKWKFSAVASFGDPTAETILEYVEIGSLSSMTLDGVAMTRKFAQKTPWSPNPYASGINMVGKDTSRILGFPRLSGSPVMKFIRPVGDKVSPILLLTGAGTMAYNVTIDLECACGVIE